MRPNLGAIGCICNQLRRGLHPLPGTIRAGADKKGERMRIAYVGLLAAAAAVMSVAGAQPAHAQLGRLIMGNQWPKVDGKYRKGNVIRASAVDRANGDPHQMFRLALGELARLSKEKGYPRFAIVKVSDCGTVLVNGSRAAVTCRLVGQMLNADEVAAPDGNNPISYFRTEDVLAGRTEPEPK